MRLLKLDARAFGCLRSSVAFAPSGLNVVLAPNEGGKTTLVEALVAALYGPLSADDGTPEGLKLGRRRPRDGGPFGVSLELEAAGRKLTIVRDFGLGKAAVYADGEDVTASFRRAGGRLELGEQLTGLARAELEASLLVGQGQLELPSDGTSLLGVLGRVAAERGAQAGSGGAIGAIERALAHHGLAGSRVVSASSEQRRLAGLLAAARQRADALAARRAELAQAAEGLEELRAERARGARRQAELAHIEKLVELEATSDELGNDRDQQARVGELDAEVAALSLAPTFSAEQRDVVERATRELEAARERGSGLEAERERLGEGIARRAAELAALGAAGRFDDKTAALVRSVLTRLVEARRARDELAARRAREEEQLRSAGVEPDSVNSRLALFGGISEDDRQFLRAIGSARSARSAELQGLEERLVDARAAIQRIDQDRSRRSRGARALLGLAVLLGAGAGVLNSSIAEPLPAAASGGAGVLCLAIGAAWLAAIRRSRAAERRETRSRLAQSERSAEELRRAAAEEGRRLAALADRLYPTVPEELPELLATAELLAARTQTWRELSDVAATRDHEAEAASAAASELLARAGRNPAGDVREALERLDADATRSLALAREQSDASHRRHEIARLADEERRRTTAARSALGPILMDADLDPELEPAELRSLFADGASRGLRLEEIALDLPRERALLLSDERRQTLAARREALVAELGTTHLEPAARERLEPLLRERDSVATRLLELDAALLTRSAALAADYDAVRSQLPEIVSDIAECETALGRLDRFQRAAAMASETLAELGVAAHAVWGKAVDGYAAEALAELLPGYAEPRFDASLRLSLLLPGETRRSELGDEGAPPLASGTRDQLNLIARLAVASYLAQVEQRPPIILDDPFARIDDDRFAATMSFLARRFARERQVIYLTSHEARQRWLLMAESELAAVTRSVSLG